MAARNASFPMNLNTSGSPMNAHGPTVSHRVQQLETDLNMARRHLQQISDRGDEIAEAFHSEKALTNKLQGQLAESQGRLEKLQSDLVTQSQATLAETQKRHGAEEQLHGLKYAVHQALRFPPVGILGGEECGAMGAALRQLAVMAGMRPPPPPPNGHGLPNDHAPKGQQGGPGPRK